MKGNDRDNIIIVILVMRLFKTTSTGDNILFKHFTIQYMATSLQNMVLLPIMFLCIITHIIDK